MLFSRRDRLIGQLIVGLLTLLLFPVFGFLGDRPSRVYESEGRVNFGQWFSAIFHTALSLVAILAFGLWGFALLPLNVLIVARRLSAWKGNPYFIKELRADLSGLLQARRVRNVALYGGALALFLQVLNMVGVPDLEFYTEVTSTFVWGTWISLAAKASGVNNAAAASAYAAHIANVGMLSKAFKTPPADWEGSDIDATGLQLIVTSPPIAARLHYDQADSILALIAPQWEFNRANSDHEVLILDEASEETKQRRLEESRSGGLIAGKLSGGDEPHSAPVLASVSITADDIA